MTGLLSGLRVLDLSQYLAGPYGAMLLGDLGAEVIKVEPPSGDPARDFAGPDHHGESFYYLAFNRNKKSITLDLQTKAGKEALIDLVKVSDVIWLSMRPSALKRLGLTYTRLKRINPRIIVCSITGYGTSGPYSERPSFDIAALAISGMLSITGEAGGPPLRPGPAIGDLVTGIFAALGVTSALSARERTGEGQNIEVSLLDSSSSLMAYHFSYYFCSGIIPRPLGSGHLSLIPYGLYGAKDDYVALGISWPRLARVLGAEHMIDDPRFSTQESRLEHRAEFEAEIEQHLQKANAKDWLELFNVEDIASGPVNNVAQAVADPQLLHQNMILNIEHPLGGKIKLSGNPIKTGPLDKEEHLPPPTLGQHHRQVLTEILGYSEEKINTIQAEADRNKSKMEAHIHKTK